MIELRDAKLLFDAGSLMSAYIQKDALLDGYVVLFDQVKGKKSVRVVYRNKRSDDVKVFKRLDSAVNAVKTIGFDSVTITGLHT